MKYYLILFLVLSACVSNFNRKKVVGSHVFLDAQKTVAVAGDPQNVEVFYERNPEGSVKDVALVEASVEGEGAGLDDLLPELKKQASKVGAKGVYKIKVQRYNHSVPAIHATGVAFNR